MTSNAPSAQVEDGARQAKITLILDAAAGALNRHGISQASLSLIAKQVGFTRAAFYYYFKDQVELVFQSYLRCCSLLDQAIDLAEETDGDAWSKLESLVDILLDEESPELVALNEIAYLLPHQQGAILRSIGRLRDRLAGIIADGVASGALRSCSERIVAASIIGVSLWLPMALRWPTFGVKSRSVLAEAVKATLHSGSAADRSARCDYSPLPFSPMTFPAVQVFDPEVMAAARREAILATASWMFNLKGVDATSLEEIAVQLGVTKKVIYHNVGDKETLLAECYRRAFRIYEDVVRRAQQYPGDRVAAASAFIHLLATASLCKDISPLEPLGGFDALPKRVRSEILATSERMFDIQGSLLRQGQIEGSIREMDITTFISIRPGFYFWLPKWQGAFEASELEAAPGEIAELLRIGVLPT